MYRCRVSQQLFDTLEEYQKHLKSDLYRFNLKRKAAGLPPITSQQWDQIQLTELIEKNKETPKSTGHIKSKNLEKNERKKKRSKFKSEENLNKLKKDEGKSVNQLIDEYIEDKRPIPTNQSLFCSHVSPDMETNLEFMRLTYGFFIPMREYCTDLNGLLTYLGEKIGVGLNSIYDNKQFGSAEACQNHMRDTSTCIMLWENNEDEYEAFYNFQGLIEREKQMSNVEVHENGYELIVNDEKILGHRQLSIYYKQGVRNHIYDDKLAKIYYRGDNIKKQKRVNIDRKDQQRIYKELNRRQFQTNNQRHYRPDNPI